MGKGVGRVSGEGRGGRVSGEGWEAAEGKGKGGGG